MVGLSVESRRDGDVAVLVLKGEARLEAVEPLREAARVLIDAGVARIVVDAAQLAFADSASIGVLLDVQRRAERAGGGLVLCGASQRFRRTLDAMGLLPRLKLLADEASARAALAPEGPSAP